ncbi:LysR family transcriptional regulator [Parapusillimonas sp. JC17]|uniref:LysR family transcriptional regulator n=1 Tax=Parapusillimonas sp. JC17 TaxID=3445768 RepID=UPI003F9F9498
MSANSKIRLRHLEAFHAVMVTGSVTGAAAMLHVSQPAVTATIKHFERKLGFLVFERMAGRLVPTPEALALLPDVQEIFSRLSALDRFSQDLADGVQGALSIAATSPVANVFLARAVASFIEQKPGAQVALHAMDSNLIAERLINGQIDLGVAFSPGDNETLHTQHLGSSELTCVMPVAHPLASLSSVSVFDLQPYPVITYVPQALLRHRLDGYLKAPLNICVQVATSLTGIVLALHGAGVALVDSSVLQALPVPALTVRPLKPSVEITSYLMWSEARPQTALARAFVAHLERLSDRPM